MKTPHWRVTMHREKIKTALWFGADQWKALKELASTMDRSVAQLVREAVDDSPQEILIQ
jgi:hypothetical protein